MPESVIVVPCYNEEARLDAEQWAALLKSEGVLLLFINDGSTDGTGTLLDQWRQNFPSSVQVHHLKKNQGKAEAIRQGLLLGLDQNAKYVGYADADLATPVSEIIRLSTILREGPETIHAVLGSRVRRLGASITRHPLRHYLGRAFATAVSAHLGIPIYDSQCGAKFFRSSEALRSALSTPFQSRWIFDVELLRRLLRDYGKTSPYPSEHFLEVPLTQWKGIQGSKVRAATFVRAAIDFLRLLIV